MVLGAAAITNLYRGLTTLYAADPELEIKCVSTPEARSRSYGANFRLPGFAPSGLSFLEFRPRWRMMQDSKKTLSSSPEEPPRSNPLLLITCIIGILIGLGVFGFACYLLMH